VNVDAEHGKLPKTSPLEAMFWRFVLFWSFIIGAAVLWFLLAACGR
jgi:hypothetical protein